MSARPVRQPSTEPMQRLVNFYDPNTKGKDELGRTLDDILGLDEYTLEHKRNYIQTLFPLPEKSSFNPKAPILDEETMIIFNQSSALRDNLIRSVKRMLSVYGFDAQVKEGTTSRLIIAAKEYPGECQRWLTPVSHNHLRITRIIRSLRILGLAGAAWDIYRVFVTIHESRRLMDPKSVDIWTHALRDPIYKAPNGTQTNWLRRYRMGCPLTGAWCTPWPECSAYKRVC
ncbi:hypothetical protein F5B18DRAFT_500671 [Nemania serpens]|nr:hypothetical protein F5B18DRAFT_500671 [Nemania serpens]